MGAGWGAVPKLGFKIVRGLRIRDARRVRRAGVGRRIPGEFAVTDVENPEAAPVAPGFAVMPPPDRAAGVRSDASPHGIAAVHWMGNAEQLIPNAGANSVGSDHRIVLGDTAVREMDQNLGSRLVQMRQFSAE